MLEKYVNKEIEILLSSGVKVTGKLMEATKLMLIMKNKENKIFHVFTHKIDTFAIEGDDEEKLFPKLNIFMCKNEEHNCKGAKFMTCKDDLTIDKVDCPCDKKKLKCEFGLVGDFFQLPRKIQMAFLEGMSTKTTPIKVDDK